jgi:hypothetical protein
MARIYKENKLRNFAMKYTPKADTLIFIGAMLLIYFFSTNFVLALLVTALYLKK